MKKLLWIIDIVILILLGLLALLGGWKLINDPTGVSMQFPIELLDQTPFDNYFIPGIILFLFIGVLSLVAAFMTVLKAKHSAFYIMVQGIILVTWLLIELIFNMEFYLPAYHIPLFLVGIYLILRGYLLKN